MSAQTRTREITKEVTVYVCDHCGNDIGSPPIQDHGGHSVNAGVVAPRGVKAISAEICAECWPLLLEWLHKTEARR